MTCCQHQEPLGTDHLTLSFGKYKGTLLSDMSDVSYLEWMLRTAKDNGDQYSATMIRRRLHELV